MRIRGLLLAGALTLAPVVAVSLSATAAGAGSTRAAKGGSSELRECIEKALEKGDSDLKTAIDECHKAKSPIVPATSELLWGSVAWLIVAGLLMKVGFPAIKKTLKAREDRIRGDLEAAEQAKAAANAEAEQYQAQLRDARNEAALIIEEGRQAADDVRRDLIARAEADAAEVRARAQADIQVATDRATSDLQARVGQLSIDLAEKIVERNLDRDTQMALVESYINQVGSN